LGFLEIGLSGTFICMFNKISFMWISKALVAYKTIYLYDYLKKKLHMHSFLDMGFFIFSKSRSTNLKTSIVAQKTAV